jgi:asparagine synthase (glutamine-hydrolysing)
MDLFQMQSSTPNIGDKLHKLAGVICKDSFEDFYLSLVSQWNPHEIVIGAKGVLPTFPNSRFSADGMDDIQQMMAIDSVTYLPDDILVKLDRASMAVSLEGRVPFLDHRVVEFAWRLPQKFKLYNGESKWILRQVLYRYVPKELIDRPKMGFGIPIGLWLRGPLRAWAENLLSESRLRQDGYFYPAPIRKKWAEHLSGKRNWQAHLWTVLMFQAWLDEN